MRYRLLINFIVLVVIVSCSGSSRPAGVLPRKKMVPIMVDIHLAEVMNNQKYNLAMIRDSLPEDLYLSICKKYKIDRTDIEKSLLWYGKHTTEYMPVYNEVLDVLSEMEVKAKSDSLKPVRKGYDLDTAKNKKSSPQQVKSEPVVN